MSTTIESFFNDGEQLIISKTKEKYVSPNYSKLDNEEMVYPESKKIRRKLFVRRINEWLNNYSSPEETYNNEDEDEEEHEHERKDKYLITNRVRCMQIYNDIKQILNKKKYVITDEYQFKEDIIFYLFSLSGK